MAARRGPTVVLAILRLVLPVLLLTSGTFARADEPPAPDDEEAAADDASAAPFADPRFGPRYAIESVVVRGNRKTATPLILAELSAIGLRPGSAVDASDPRVEAARYRLLTLGFFLDVRLSVSRGTIRGSVVLVVDVEERGTLVINELFPTTSTTTTF